MSLPESSAKSVASRIPDRVRGWASVCWRWLPKNKTGSLYVSSSLAVTFANLVTGLIVVRYVSPAEMGLWSSAKLWVTYSFFALAGVLNGLGRELPFSLGKEDHEGASKLASTAAFCVDLASTLALLVGCVVAATFWEAGPDKLLAVIGVSAVIVMNFQRNYYLSTFRSSRAFSRLAINQYLEAGIQSASVMLVVWFGYEGLVGRVILVTFVVLMVLRHWRPMRIPSRFDYASFRCLLKTGFPIFALDYVRSICSTVDRLVLLALGGVTAVGLYTLAIVAVEVMGALPQSFSQYLSPRMTFDYGKTGNPLVLWNRVIRGSLLAAAACAGAALAGSWFLRPAVEWFAPQYIDGIVAAKVMLWSGVPQALALPATALWAMKHWRLMTFYQLGGSALMALSPLLFIGRIDNLLLAVAWGVFVGSTLRAVFALVVAYRGTHSGSIPGNVH